MAFNWIEFLIYSVSFLRFSEVSYVLYPYYEEENSVCLIFNFVSKYEYGHPDNDY
jgi:hypothetical protein